MSLVYLNNFPRENAIKGQEFKGNSDLKEELLNRGIIGGEEVVEEITTSTEEQSAKSNVSHKKGK